MTRLAIAGAGWAGRVHTLAAAAVQGVTVPVVAARSVGSAEELAATISARPVAGAALPAGADAVIVATPPTSHADLAVRLLQGGTPVLIEKPLAATLAEADAIIAAAEAGGAAACYAENLLFAPALDVAVNRRIALGRIDHLEVRMAQPMPTWGHFAGPLTAGGVLFDLGVHAAAVLTLLARDDEPVAVRARLASSRPDGADDVGRVEVRFASDLIAAMDLSWNSDVVEWSAQASSPTGVVRVEFQPEITVEVDGVAVELPHVDSEIDSRIFDLGYHAQLEGFCSVVARRGGRVCPAGFGRSMLDLVCAAYASAGRDGDEVLLPFQGPRDLTPMQLWRGP